MKIVNDSNLALVIKLLKQIPRKYEDENLPFSLQIDKNIEILEGEQKALEKLIQDLVQKHALTDDNGQYVPNEGVEKIKVIADIQFVDFDAFNKELEEAINPIYEKEVKMSVIDCNKIYLHKSGNKISYENFISNYLVNKMLLIDNGKAKVMSSTLSNEERNVIDSIIERYAKTDADGKVEAVEGVPQIKTIADIKMTSIEAFDNEFEGRDKNMPVYVFAPRRVDIVGLLNEIGALKLPE